MMQNADEIVPLSEEFGIYVKQCAKMYITICLPTLKQPGQSISNWDLMERIKKAVSPIQLTSFRVVTSTVENVRFEAELQSRKLLLKVVKALDGYLMKVVGFFEPLKVRAAEAKTNFPTRHDWDEFFRTASDMNELKPGERPDTIYLAKLPSNWFKEKDSKDGLPSEQQFKRVFERFGTVRCVDIPICDPYRRRMPPDFSGIRSSGFSFGQEVVFEAYVQFEEYTSFMKAMDFLRNMKLVKVMADGKQFEALINVDFDRSKHLSDENILKRQAERERLCALERRTSAEEAIPRKSEDIPKTVVQTENKERCRIVNKKSHSQSQERKRSKEKRRLSEMIAEEERKLLIAQRKLESRRLLSALICRIEERELDKDAKERVADEIADSCLLQVHLGTRLRQALLKEHEQRLRSKIEAKLSAKLSKKEADAKTE